MGSIWGNSLKISIFGESHSNGVGVTIDGLPPGLEINLNLIRHQLWRRSTNREYLTTSRKERDNFEVISGLFNNKSTGTPLTAIFKNEDVKSDIYKKNSYIPRPGTADYTSGVRYDYNNDFRGGGHNSARLMTGLVFAGNICYQYLNKMGIVIGSHVSSIYNKRTNLFDRCNIDSKLLNRLSMEYFPVIDIRDRIEYKRIIDDIDKLKSSVGGELEVAAIGIKEGIGTPIFDSLESKIASIMFSIPSVKCVDFGYDISEKDGYSANDKIYYDSENKIKTKTNNSGGILGGITTGMPIVFKISLKPIPSIKRCQDTVNIKTKENTIIHIDGRHDICSVVRAAPIVEAGLAIAIMDAILEINKK